MLIKLPIDILHHIESFIHPHNFKEKCLEFRNFIYELEIIGASSLWRYRPYWKEYRSYWDNREYIYEILSGYIDMLMFRLSNKFLNSIRNDSRKFLENLDTEAIWFTSDNTSIFCPMIQTVAIRRRAKDCNSLPK